MTLFFLQTDMASFVGRLHPLVVHLPIGFLLLAVVFFFLGKRKGYQFLRKALPVTLFLGAVSSVLAAAIGWLLGHSGGYGEDALFWHQWMGISVSVLAILTWLWSIKKIKVGQKVAGFAMVGIIALLSMTGHLGGNLTHGEDYLLAYAPEFVKKTFGTGEGSAGEERMFPSNPDSIRIYRNFIQPILNEKCVACHNDGKKKGDLLMQNLDEVLAGGDNGAVVVPHVAMESELLRRVTLNTRDSKYMPPSGTPMSYNEIKLLEYWIDSGATDSLTIKSDSIPIVIRKLIESEYGITDQKRSYVDIKKVEAADAETIAELSQMGFSVRSLSERNNFLDVIMLTPVDKKKLDALLTVKDQIGWLDLSNSDLQDDQMAIIGQFPNLVKLNLAKNTITDTGIGQLARTKHLEILNVYGTKITDAGLANLEGLNELQTIFLWQTAATKAGGQKLKTKVPALQIDWGS